MLAEIASKGKFGHSFKGAFAYYLHDKREGERPTSSDRVAWTETRNVALNDPAYAQSIMIATARNADQLKREAGIKATGRKSTAGVVMAYSLAWHPDKEAVPDREEMLRAADMSIKYLKAQDLQAVIICHTDTKHPHVHVVLNRIDPNNGKVSTKDEMRQLSKFREAYEIERGQHLTKRRGEEKRQEKEKPPPQPQLAPPEPPPKDQWALLGQADAEMKKRHKQEWGDFTDAHKKRRKAILAKRIDFRAIAEQNREQHQPQWDDLKERQTKERQEFIEREKSLFGIVRNAIKIINEKGRGLQGDRKLLANLFKYTLSHPARVKAFKQQHSKERGELNGRQEKRLQELVAVPKAAREAELKQARQDYATGRDNLIQGQDRERAAMREEWKAAKIERERKPLPKAQQQAQEQAKAERAAQAANQAREEFGQRAAGPDRQAPPVTPQRQQEPDYAALRAERAAQARAAFGRPAEDPQRQPAQDRAREAPGRAQQPPAPMPRAEERPALAPAPQRQQETAAEPDYAALRAERAAMAREAFKEAAKPDQERRIQIGPPRPSR